MHYRKSYFLVVGGLYALAVVLCVVGYKLSEGVTYFDYPWNWGVFLFWVLAFLGAWRWGKVIEHDEIAGAFFLGKGIAEGSGGC